MTSAPANFSLSVLRPSRTGIASSLSAKSLYTPSIRSASASASSRVSCAVCPSCHRNSVVRRNSRVTFSQRTTLAHWLMSSGRSRHDWIHLAYMVPMMASDVGRTTRRSSSFSSPPWVTQATCGANPSTCAASFRSRLSGMNSGKYALTWPVALKRASSEACISSQTA